MENNTLSKNISFADDGYCTFYRSRVLLHSALICHLSHVSVYFLRFLHPSATSCFFISERLDVFHLLLSTPSNFTVHAKNDDLIISNDCMFVRTLFARNV